MALFSLRKNTKPDYRLVSGEFEGLTFVGHYDFNLLKYKPKSAYPYMLGISVQGFQTNDKKLPLNDERSEIDALEDHLIDLVKTTTDSIYAGHSFWNDSLEIIMYLKDYEKVIKVLEHDAEKKRKLTYTFKIDSDPAWAQLRYLTNTK